MSITKVEFFNDTNVQGLENAINTFLATGITVISMQQSQSSYVMNDQDTDKQIDITIITVCVFYKPLKKTSSRKLNPAI